MTQLRIDAFERQLRVTQAACTGLAVVVVVLFFRSELPVSAQSDELRARSLTIVDAEGRERVIIGAPVPDPAAGRRISPSTGIVINDENGRERFGLGLKETGDMGMGFDAPVGTGDDRNRERINIVADSEGGAYIRFLDRRTLVKSRIFLDDDNEVRLEFIEFEEGSINRRQMGFEGSRTIRVQR